LVLGMSKTISQFLQAMVEVVAETSGDTRAEFVYCEKLVHEIGTAVSSLATSLAQTRTTLMRDMVGGDARSDTLNQRRILTFSMIGSFIVLQITESTIQQNVTWSITQVFPLGPSGTIIWMKRGNE
jgi:hypothetical protein